MTAIRRRLWSLSAAAATALLLAACSGEPVATHPGFGSLGPRPSSPATVEIVQPAQGATVTGESAHVVLRLTGGIIVPETTTELHPDRGHLHLYVNNQLVSMNYGLEQDIPVQPGTLVLRAEFVAADHFPFSPRVYSDDIVFTVTG
jgi:hypothetical protein